MASKRVREIRELFPINLPTIPQKSSVIAAPCEIFVPSMIISGGQTGADMGGLQGAEACDIMTGGIAPKGWRTENGPYPELAKYGLIEHNNDHYDDRTLANIHLANAVLLIAADFDSPGTKLTKNAALGLWRGVFDVPYPRLQSLKSEFYVPDIRNWLAQLRPDVLMIAGNRESKAKGIQEWTRNLIIEIFLDKVPARP